MGADKRFVRFWCEFEVEIVDEIALKAIDLDEAVDDNGQFAGAMQWDSIERLAGRRLTDLMSEGLRKSAARIGVTVLAAPVAMPRFRNTDGDWLSQPIVAMPGRNSDGIMRPGPPLDLSE